jgi:hypothetical protein
MKDLKKGLRKLNAAEIIRRLHCALIVLAEVRSTLPVTYTYGRFICSPFYITLYTLLLPSFSCLAVIVQLTRPPPLMGVLIDGGGVADGDIYHAVRHGSRTEHPALSVVHSCSWLRMATVHPALP